MLNGTENIKLPLDKVFDYDLMNGVTISDNSGELVDIKASGNLVVAEGTYLIT